MEIKSIDIFNEVKRISEKVARDSGSNVFLLNDVKDRLKVLEEGNAIDKQVVTCGMVTKVELIALPSIIENNHMSYHFEVTVDNGLFDLTFIVNSGNELNLKYGSVVSLSLFEDLPFDMTNIEVESVESLTKSGRLFNKPKNTFTDVEFEEMKSVIYQNHPELKYVKVLRTSQLNVESTIKIPVQNKDSKVNTQ